MEEGGDMGRFTPMKKRGGGKRFNHAMLKGDTHRFGVVSTQQLQVLARGAQNVHKTF